MGSNIRSINIFSFANRENETNWCGLVRAPPNSCHYYGRAYNLPIHIFIQGLLLEDTL
jgi:hypothetical protein